MSTLIRKHKCVGFVGLSQAGKSVLLTSLINQFRNHDPEKLKVGTRNGRIVEAERLPPCYAKEREFDYDDNRHRLSVQRWPKKTTVLQEYRALYTRTDWNLGVLDLSLLDIPGERLADMLIADCPKYAEWCDKILNALRNSQSFMTNCGKYFWLVDHHAKNSGDLTKSDEAFLLEAYRTLLAKMILSHTNLVTPSSFLTTPNGEYVSKETLSVPQEKLEQTLVERQFCGVSANEQFAPVSPEFRAKYPKFTATLAASYDKYRKQVVLPFAQTLAGCDELFVLVDIADILDAGVGMFNATTTMLEWLLKYTSPGFGSTGFAVDWLLQMATGGSFDLPGIRRLVFVATKADRVHEQDRENLRSLLKQLCQPSINKYETLRSLTVEYEVCSAVNSTRSEKTANERYLQYFKKGQSETPVRERVQTIPSEWADNWKAGDYAFPRPRPSMAANKMKPPEQFGLHRIAEKIVSF